jgi:hypothetical protein
MRLPNDWPNYSAEERARWLWHAVVCEARSDWVRYVAALLTRAGELEAALARLAEAGEGIDAVAAGGADGEQAVRQLREAVAAARALLAGAPGGA